MPKAPFKSVGFLIISLLFTANISTAESTRQHRSDVATGPIPYHHAREVLAVIKTSTNTTDVQDAYTYLQRLPITDHDDLMAIYTYSKDAERNMPRFLHDEEYDAWGQGPELVTQSLGKAAAPQLQDDIATLLQNELTELRGRHAQLDTVRNNLRDSLFSDRFQALINAAGSGKNEKARKALWDIVDYDQDNSFGQAAVEALGGMRHPEDLDRLIGMVRNNPSLRLNLNHFGEIAGPRLLKELNDPSLPSNLQGRFASDIGDSISRDHLKDFVPLLKSNNDDLVHQVARGIGTRLKPNDIPTLRQMLENPNPEVRGAAILAMDLNAWSDACIPLLLDALKNDPSYINRITVTSVLGHHRVRRAIPGLTEASQHDSDSTVRAGADSALKSISGQ